MRSKWSVLGSILVVGVLAVACAGGDDGASNDGGSDAAAPVTLTASGFAFRPTELSAPAGGTIEFTNDDDAEHSFTSEDADLDVDAHEGETVTIDLSEVEPGSYDFFCEYHPDTMTGTLEVTG